MSRTARTGTAEDHARAWLEVDPDDDTRAELEAILGRPDELEERFRGRLEFGTAGMRGALGAGPRRMNRVLVRSVAAALARRVIAGSGPDARIVIGFDARHKSDVFASDSARVFAAHGLRVTVLPRPLPTPVLAFAVRHTGSAAGVMVTASHNPPADNGYKVYWADGAQIVPPVDAEIAAEIDSVGLVAESDLVSSDDSRITVDDGSIESAYLDMAVGVVEDGPRELATVYTAMHGVGRDVVVAAFTRAGFAAPIEVAEQCEPDPDFPTVTFPNPEEPGALDLSFALASRHDVDLVIANDPDADRLAVAVPGADGWRPLSGNEIGCLLADHLLTRGPEGPDRLVANTVVSSRLLARVADAHGVHYAETLTGFKWIVRPGFEHPEWQFVMGYEEALGYAVTDRVADKDGVTAALVMAELAATEKARGRTLVDRLDDLTRAHGLHRTIQRSIRFSGDDAQADMAVAMSALRAAPPGTVAGRAVESFTDLLGADTGWTPTDAVILELGPVDRLVVRPSGTEPKLKLYAETVNTLIGPDLRDAEADADALLADLLDRAPADLGLG